MKNEPLEQFRMEGFYIARNLIEKEELLLSGMEFIKVLKISWPILGLPEYGSSL